MNLLAFLAYLLKRIHRQHQLYLFFTIGTRRLLSFLLCAFFCLLTFLVVHYSNLFYFCHLPCFGALTSRGKHADFVARTAFGNAQERRLIYPWCTVALIVWSTASYVANLRSYVRMNSATCRK